MLEDYFRQLRDTRDVPDGCGWGPHRHVVDVLRAPSSSAFDLAKPQRSSEPPTRAVCVRSARNLASSTSATTTTQSSSSVFDVETVLLFPLGHQIRHLVERVRLNRVLRSAGILGCGHFGLSIRMAKGGARMDTEHGELTSNIETAYGVPSGRSPLWAFP